MDYYQKNLDFWETAWARVTKAHKELPKLDYIEEIPQAFKKHQCKHILDIACGSGWLAFYLQERGFKVTGVDISESAIKLANGWKQEDAIEDVDFFVGDMFNLESLLEGTSFDGIVINACFEHLDYKRGREFLQKIKSYVKPGGVMFAVFDKVATGDKGSFETLEDGSRVYNDEFRDGMLLRNYPDEELFPLLEELGWQVESKRVNDWESRVVVAING